ncbi:MAG: PocR ligand-binding domain-containing protein [Desulfotignum sp.]|nr:PocR ligand-binding domain-containing protein [Desulfotignum sp.]
MDKKRDDLSVIKAVLDGIEDVIYVADPDTFELLHVNETFQTFWGKDVLGKKCYRVLQNRDTPCPFCTNDKIFGEYAGRSYVWEFQNEVTGDWYRCVDRAIDWVDGRKVRFELASDISSLKQTEKQLREHQSALEQKVRERTEKLDEELRQREKTEQKLRESEAAIRKKLKAISEPDADLEGLTLSDIIDIDQLQPVMEDFHRITGIANAVIDIDGNVLAGVGWQDICTKFHRCHPESQKNCIESDIELSKDIPKGTFKAYRCKNNLWDMATPIMLGDRRLGNLFIGQYLQNDDEFDKALFLDQARRYGFDEQEYMAALARVPRMDKGRVKEIMGFFSRFSQMISAMSLNTIQLSRTLTERKQVEQALKHKSSINEAINRVFREVLQYETEDAVAQFALNVAEELTGSRFGFIGEINDQGRLDTIGISNPGWENCNMEGSSATVLIKDMAVRGIWATVVKTGATQIINQPSSHPERVGIPEGHPPLTSFMGVPFIRDNHAVGLIALANKEAGYTERDKETIESLAAPFYEVLLRKRMENRIREEALKKEALAELSERMGGNPSVKQLCTDVITYLCQQFHAPTGLMYVTDETGDALTLTGGYAYRPRTGRSHTYRPGEGLVGQAAADKKILIVEDVPENYLSIESGIIDMPPQVVMLKPIIQNDRVSALLEMGFRRHPDGHELALLESMDERIASAVQSARDREIQDRMLEESRQMTEKLQIQQEELQSANEELEEQTQLLTASEARLKEQQEELQAANEELEEKSQYLERNKQEVEQKNRRPENLQKELTRKADDLSIASKYKSEFLANMSHELRTPLNSLLLLSKLLTKNKEQNLTEDQLESVQVIYNSGSQLLSLINEILDLSKIEAGKMDLHFDAIPTASLADGLKRHFKHMADNKHLDFVVNVAQNCPETIVSDRQRIDQVLKNLVSNAIKFTDQGSVTIDFTYMASGKVPGNPDLDGQALMAISIRDTGIGVPDDKQKIIFEAFQQAETGSSRKFGGTGLGLSISRELAHLLGGAIALDSRSGQGSTFTLYLPLDHPSEKTDSTRNSRPRPDLFAPTARPSEEKRIHLRLK